MNSQNFKLPFFKSYWKSKFKMPEVEIEEELIRKKAIALTEV